MPLTAERVKSMLAWRQANPDQWAQINRNSSRRYYDKHKDKILAKRKTNKKT